MYGNVWEWCNDWYGENYYRIGEKADPSGPATGQRRVLRGGSWGDNAPVCRSATRVGHLPSKRLNGFGFRVVFHTDDLD
jgi:formylglycine-generating enzyme required for sulfatase activity